MHYPSQRFDVLRSHLALKQVSQCLMTSSIVFAIQPRHKKDAVELVLHTKRLKAPDTQTRLRVTEVQVTAS